MYIEGSQFKIPNSIAFFSLKNDFVLANSAYPQCNAACVSWLFAKVLI